MLPFRAPKIDAIKTEVEAMMILAAVMAMVVFTNGSLVRSELPLVTLGMGLEAIHGRQHHGPAWAPL